MDTIYYYSIGYYSYEEAPKTILTHTEKFSKEEFDEMIFECISELIETIGDDSFDSYLDDIIELMKNKHDFKELEITTTFHPFGWASMFFEDWTYDTENDQDMIFLRNKFKK